MPETARDRERRTGRRRRTVVPRTSHRAWEPPANRPDPIALLDAENVGRLPALVPVRWGRMLESPFAFMRGAAGLMAADLARTPSSGLQVQLCGDAHMANFGVFASPERRLLFDVNDFDETTPGPWEWDLKRLAASAVVVGRVSGIPADRQAAAARAAARAYRRHMTQYAGMDTLDVWYARVDAKAASRTVGRRAPAPASLGGGRGPPPDLPGGIAQADGANRRGAEADRRSPSARLARGSRRARPGRARRPGQVPRVARVRSSSVVGPVRGRRPGGQSGQAMCRRP